MNSLENQLLAWKPRRPSPGLEARLFGALEPDRPDLAAASFFNWQWLAPAMAVFLAGVFVVGPGNSGLSRFDDPASAEWAANVALARPDLSTYCTARRHSENNVLSGARIEWTENRPAAVAPAPTSPGRTNSPTP